MTNVYANPGGYPVTLRVAGPGGAATNARAGLIGVAAVPAPSFTGPGALSVPPAGGPAVFTFTGSNGVRYRLVYRNDLMATDTGWTAMTPPVPEGWTNGGSGAITLRDAGSAAATQRFYRIEAKSVSAP